MWSIRGFLQGRRLQTLCLTTLLLVQVRRFLYNVVGFRGPLQNHMMWANVLPLRRAFLYIKLATDLRSRASIDPRTYRTDQEEENEVTKAGRLRSGLRVWSDY